MSAEFNEQNFDDSFFGQTPEEVAQELVDFKANQLKLDEYVSELTTNNPDLKGWAVKSGDEFMIYKYYDEMFVDLESRSLDLKRISVMKIDQPRTLII